MRFRERGPILAAVAALCMAALFGLSAFAQEVIQFEGSVMKTGANGKNEPIEGALVDIHRTDIKSKPWSLKTQKNGRFVLVGAPIRATVTVIVSAPGFAPKFQAGVRVAQTPTVSFVLDPGDGHRPTLEEVSSGGGNTGPTTPRVSEAERKRAEEEEAARAAEATRQEAMQADFNTRLANFDAGIAAGQAKDYRTEVEKLTAALEGIDTANEKFHELIHKASGNLAEAHYQVAVDLYNNAKDKPNAEQHLRKAFKAVDQAIRFASDLETNKPIYISIQGKVAYLLVDKFGDSKLAEAGAAAFSKAAEIETDPQKKVQFMLQIADCYRAGLVAEFNSRDFSEQRALSYKEKAYAGYKAVLAVDKNNPAALYRIGLTGMASADPQDFQIAANYLKVLVDTSPNDPNAVEAKKTLMTLEKDFKIKPKPVQ